MPSTHVPHEAPRAETRPHTITSPHGSRIDPYYWLRDDERRDPRVLAHLAAENAHTDRELSRVAALRETLYGEIVGRLRQDDSTVPYRKNGFWYYTRYEAGQEHPIFARRKDAPDALEEVMLDANAQAADHDYYQIGELDVSPDTRYLAFCEDVVGRREYRMRFKDLTTGELLADCIEGIEADLAWGADNRSVLYVRKDAETLLGLYVQKHVLGTSHDEDALIFEQADRSFYTGVSRSKSDRFLFIHMHSTVSSEWRYAEASDPKLEFRVFAPHERDHEYEIDHVDDRFIVRTNWQARNFRLIEVPIGSERNRDAWRDLVAHRDDTFIEDYEVFAEFVALSVRHEGLRKVGYRSLDPEQAPCGAVRYIEADDPAYTMSIAGNPELSNAQLRYTYSSLSAPRAVYDYDVRSGERTLLKREPVLGGYDCARYRTEFLWVPARDGRAVPVSLVYREDHVRDGRAPLLLYAYGAYGLSMDPAFSSARLSLLDRGFVFAIAHVRGGQELGRAWYEEGRLLRKTNSFDDYIDVTRHLVAAGYGAPDKIFGMGGSAGGLLMGAVANRCGSAFRGLVAQVPFVDVVTTMLDETIPLTTNEYDEWGDPTRRENYDYMLSYSPYDNVAARDYPAMLVTAGLWDSQVQYFEPAKWVAKLRSLKTDANRLLLHVDMESGHGGKSGRFEHHRETAMEYAFILGELGITD